MKYLALALAILSGCATFKMDHARQVATAAYNTTGRAAELLNKVDADKQAGIRLRALGDRAGAQKELGEWLATYDKLEKAVVGTFDAIGSCLAVLDAVASGVAHDDINVVVVKALAAMSSLVKTFADAGLHVPGVS